MQKKIPKNSIYTFATLIDLNEISDHVKQIILGALESEIKKMEEE